MIREGIFRIIEGWLIVGFRRTASENNNFFKWKIYPIVFVVLVFIFVLCIFWHPWDDLAYGHGNGKQDSNYAGVATGTVIEIDSQKFVIFVDGSCALYDLATTAEFNTDVISKDHAPDLKVGDVVQIVYNDQQVERIEGVAKVPIVFAVYRIVDGELEVE